ncbi:hypothetical protein F5Y08DRAFT_119098 [Xylaria arbuscula]|nr:hypothetical protein F5Y08DRAFT_119098 [Xylaria arbuscula]
MASQQQQNSRSPSSPRDDDDDLQHSSSQVLLPTDAAYKQRIASYWSNTAKQAAPARILRPRTASQLAHDLVRLVRSRTLFSVRSGGHSVSEGTNNISSSGVAIDLSLFDEVSFNAEEKTVRIGTGCLWKNVYAELQKHDRGVAGGRAGTVGVGGLLLGGGNTWLTAERGWACDNIVAAEVVLADGQIVTASRDAHADLFQVLKGGGNNFGIVTRFTLSTVALGKVWGGILVVPKEHTPQICAMTSSFVPKIAESPANNLFVVLGYSPEVKDVAACVGILNTRGEADDPVFEEWRQLPTIAATIQTTTVYDLSFTVIQPENYYTSWFTLTFKNDARIMTRAASLHDDLVSSLQSFVPDGDFISQCVFQPLPMIISQHSVRAGGNIMGLEDNNGGEDGGILFQALIQMKTEEQHVFGYAQLKAYVERVREFAASMEGGGLLPWLYMNYADKSQDVLASYGPKNVKKMREVADRYDPDTVFQTLCPGGWKLPKLDG